MSALLADRTRTVPATLARDPPADAPAGAEVKPGADAASPIAGLAARAGSAAGLRAMLAAEPGLGRQIAAYFAAAEDPALNELMAAGVLARPLPEKPRTGARPAATASAVDKNPTDPTVPLPAPITDAKRSTRATMKWTLKAATRPPPAATSTSSPTRRRWRRRASASARP